ncbi:MAG: Ni/Fe-hydrogenase, b-type cytochrome subunit [Bacteroidetes bacterium]|nr:MAG: Ni/Fe-hydrogenase, b-type cytochrome subunit [Bacteroidota bacterium]PTM12279.1 MAG: Ni/Fe-hydrogenase, b-type cytochrome subunit [Bacteroidota bacterium]
MKTTSFRRVYVWELPVRLFHWINALCITVLCITGYLIANPPAILSAAEASNSFWFGTNRFIHFATAYVFLFNLVFRFYWSFVGNKYANWRNFFSFNRRFFRRIARVLKLDILLLDGQADAAVGHNALAGLSYFVLFLASLVMIFTGFGMYADMSTWWLPQLFAWVPGAAGGDYLLREIHHATMWLIIVFVLIHLYLVFFHDRRDGLGETSSMISGYKFVEEEAFPEARQKKLEQTNAD